MIDQPQKAISLQTVVAQIHTNEQVTTPEELLKKITLCNEIVTLFIELKLQKSDLTAITEASEETVESLLKHNVQFMTSSELEKYLKLLRIHKILTESPPVDQ